MAKDDYHVIVYQILTYLYTKLKEGEPIDPKMISHDSHYLKINEKYWLYIMENLLKYGYVSGITVTKSWGNEVFINGLDNCEITPLGIEFLCENSFLNKAKEFLKDAKSIVPFV